MRPVKAVMFYVKYLNQFLLRKETETDSCCVDTSLWATEDVGSIEILIQS